MDKGNQDENCHGKENLIEKYHYLLVNQAMNSGRNYFSVIFKALHCMAQRPGH